MADRSGCRAEHCRKRESAGPPRRFKERERFETVRLELQDHVDPKRPLIAIRALIKWFGISRQRTVVANFGSDQKPSDRLRHRWFDGDASRHFKIGRFASGESARIRSDWIAPYKVDKIVIGAELTDIEVIRITPNLTPDSQR